MRLVSSLYAFVASAYLERTELYPGGVLTQGLMRNGECEKGSIKGDWTPRNVEWGVGNDKKKRELGTKATENGSGDRMKKRGTESGKRRNAGVNFPATKWCLNKLGSQTLKFSYQTQCKECHLFMTNEKKKDLFQDIITRLIKS